MSNALTYRVEEGVAHSILNTIYAIFLGLLFTFFFHQETKEGVVSGVDFLLTRHNWVPVVLLSVYFVVDWLTANITLSLKGAMNHLLLMVLIVLISYLGGLVVLAFSPRLNFYFLFAVYAFIVPWWDLCIASPHDGLLGLGGRIVTSIVLILRVITGAFLALLVSIRFWLGTTLGPDMPSAYVDDNGDLLWIVAAYVLLKITRYLVYVHYDPSR